MKGNSKQNSKRKKGNAVLQKYMVAVNDFIKGKSDTGEEENDHGMTFIKNKSRKELRKEKRKMKKAKMKSHYEGVKFPSLLGVGDSGISTDKLHKKNKIKKAVTTPHSSKFSSSLAEKSDNSRTPPTTKKRRKTIQHQESRKMALLEANKDEDREIKKLERCLGLNKRKNKKTLPQSFVADGLDYILGMLDSGSSAAGAYDDDNDMNMAKENFEKLDDNDSDLSHVDENPGDDMTGEVSDEEMSSSDLELDDDDTMVEDEEAEGAKMDDDDGDAADSDDDKNEVEAEQETDTPETSASKMETVSSTALTFYIMAAL